MEVCPHDCGPLLEKAVEKIVQYSNQKFSSNVIEKCVVIAPQEIRKEYLVALVKSERLSELMKNKYGNYVILKLLSTSDIEGKQLMLQHIVKNLNLVNVAKYRSRWAQFIDENPMKIPGVNTTQTVKPSLFKNSSQNDGSAKDTNESNSPSSNEGWKRNPKDKEEKSQFYQGNPKVEENPGSGQKRGKNANQKFYTEKGQHYMNKGGHNNFY
jgi:hypothetical protein